MSKTKVYIPTYKIEEGRWYYKYPAMSTNKKANQVCEDLLKENKIVETKVVTALIDINKVNNFIKKYNKVALSAEGKKLQLKTFGEFKPDVTDNWALHANNLFGTWAPYKVSKNKNINTEQAFYGAMLEDGNGKNVLLRFHNADDKKEQKIIDLLNKNGIKVRKADLGGDNFTPNMIATASAETTQFYYKGQVITASSREEAIKRISATQNKIASSECIVASRKSIKNLHRIEVPEGIEQEVPKGIVFDNYDDEIILYPETNEKAFDSMFEEAEVRFDDGKEFQEFVTKNKQSMQDFVRILNELKNNAFFKEITKNMN